MAAKAKSPVTFSVTGDGQFPFDMLRYDSCWPAHPQDVSLMSSRSGTLRRVTLVGLHAPTDGRWASFGWPVNPTR